MPVKYTGTPDVGALQTPPPHTFIEIRNTSERLYPTNLNSWLSRKRASWLMFHDGCKAPEQPSLGRASTCSAAGKQAKWAWRFRDGSTQWSRDTIIILDRDGILILRTLYRVSWQVRKMGTSFFCCFTKTALFCLTFSWFYFPETFVAEEKKSFFNFFLSDK